MTEKRENQKRESFEVDKLRLLDCKKLKFHREKSGYLTVDYGGEAFAKINPTRLTPYFSKTRYISLSYENEERELCEVGVIEDMAALDEEQYRILDDYLEYKYFMPEITKIYSIRDNMRGSIFVKSDTTSGSKTICVRDWFQNFRLIGQRLYVTDADGNKYFCSDIAKLDKKSRMILEMFT